MINKLGLILLIIGFIGFIINRKSILFLLLTLELMLLAIAFIFIFIAISYNDLFGLIYALFVLVLAGAEAAVGLTLIISFYKSTASLEFINF